MTTLLTLATCLTIGWVLFALLQLIAALLERAAWRKVEKARKR